MNLTTEHVLQQGKALIHSPQAREKIHVRNLVKRVMTTLQLGTHRRGAVRTTKHLGVARISLP